MSRIQLVLSLMPGIDLLGMAFKAEGFCVVQGGDVLFGGDVRKEHYPPGKFDGIISGPPCQAFSRLANMVRARGRKPKFGNLIPDFERCVAEARPQWFVMEEVPNAPLPSVAGYATWSTLLNNRQCFDEDGQPAKQNRVRRWTFGDARTGVRTALMIDVAVFENQEYEFAALGGSHGSSLGNAGWDGGKEKRRVRANGMEAIGHDCRSKNDFETLKRKQGLPDDFDIPPFTVAAKCKAVGNGVPIPMGRAIARAVKEATSQP